MTELLTLVLSLIAMAFAIAGLFGAIFARRWVLEARRLAHREISGWGGVPGECGVQCVCGVTYDGFDSLAEASALLARHIAGERGE